MHQPSLKKMTGLGAPIALQDLLASIFSSDEAVILADRILFMKPGHICADLPVTMARPRRETNMVGTAPYCHLREQVIGLFYDSEEDVRS